MNFASDIKYESILLLQFLGESVFLILWGGGDWGGIFCCCQIWERRIFGGGGLFLIFSIFWWLIKMIVSGSLHIIFYEFTNIFFKIF